MARASRVVVPVTFAILGLLAGCLGTYFTLSIFWTHVVARYRPLTSEDGYAVFTISILAGLTAAGLAILFYARHYRFPPTRNFRVEFDRRSKRPALTL